MTSRRFESIGGILNRTVPPRPDDQQRSELQPAARSTPTSDATDPVSAPASTARQGRPSAKVSAKSDGGVRRIAFRLDPALHEALTARATTDKISQGQVVLDSIEAAHRSRTLQDLVAAERDEPQTDGLFPRLRGRNTAQATVPVEIRLHAQAAAVLDELVNETSAESRTQLIIAALRRSLV